MVQLSIACHVDMNVFVMFVHYEVMMANARKTAYQSLAPDDLLPFATRDLEMG